MKMKFLFAFIPFLSLALLAQELPIDGNFNQNKADGTSSSWELHPWHGYQPLATIQVNTAGEFHSLSVDKVEAESGTCIRTVKRFPGRSGDEVKISLRARGQGTAGVQLYYFTDTQGGGWCLKLLTPILERWIVSSEDWKGHRILI